MAITYPLHADYRYSADQFDSTQRDRVNAVAFHFRATGTARNTGARWETDIVLPPMKRATAEPWVTFLTSFMDPMARFFLGDPIGATARGSAQHAGNACCQWRLADRRHAVYRRPASVSDGLSQSGRLYSAWQRNRARSFTRFWTMLTATLAARLI